MPIFPHAMRNDGRGVPSTRFCKKSEMGPHARMPSDFFKGRVPAFETKKEARRKPHQYSRTDGCAAHARLTALSGDTHARQVRGTFLHDLEILVGPRSGFFLFFLCCFFFITHRRMCASEPEPPLSGVSWSCATFCAHCYVACAFPRHSTRRRSPVGIWAHERAVRCLHSKP